MNVLLIQSHLGRTEGECPVFPLGLSYLAASLTGHTVRILDMNLWPANRAATVLREQLVAEPPDVVGLSIRNIDTTQRADVFVYFKTVRPTARLIKETVPNARLLVGGPGFSIFPAQIMARVPEFDFGIYLEGERSLGELLDNLDTPHNVKGIYIRQNDEVSFTGPRAPHDFSSLPMPSRDPALIDIQRYTGNDGSNIGIQTKRGCELGCAYCNYPHLNGHRFRLRAPDQVVDEIENLLTLGVSKFSFVDSVFNVPASHAHDICAEILKRKLNVTWSAWFEIANTTEDLVQIARAAGCVHIGFSPDGATDRLLAQLNKGISEVDITRSLRVIRRTNGIRAGYNFFMLPGMTLRDVLRTLGSIVTIPIATRGKARVMGLGWVRIEPETKIHRVAVSDGIIGQDTDLLPETEQELSDLFYCSQAAKFRDFLIMFLFRFIENDVKPFAKRIFRRGERQDPCGDRHDEH